MASFNVTLMMNDGTQAVYAARRISTEKNTDYDSWPGWNTPRYVLDGIQEPVRDGYKFLGWYKDAECTEPVSLWGDTVATDTTYYAGWAKKLSVTLMDGNKEIGSVETYVGAPLSDISAPKKEGSFFDGWYDDGALYSTNKTLNMEDFTSDIFLQPVFKKLYTYNVISNSVTYKYSENDNYVTYETGLFSIPRWSGWSGSPRQPLENYGTERLSNMDMCSFRHPVETEPARNDFVFAYWLKDDGTTPVTDGTSLAGFWDQNNNMREQYNGLDRNTTFVAFYKPVNDYIVRINMPAEGGSFEHKAVYFWVDGTRKVKYKDETLFEYYFAGDHPLIEAKPQDGWYFDGWYNNGTEKISSDKFFNVYEYVYGETYTNSQFPECHLSTPLEPHLKDLNLTPVFKPILGYFNV